jgi:hypothetical protein
MRAIGCFARSLVLAVFARDATLEAMRYRVSADPFVAEAIEISREMSRIRGQMFLLGGAIVLGAFAVMERCLAGVGSHFLVHWISILVASLLAFAASTHLRRRQRVLNDRANRLATMVSRSATAP